MLCVSTLVSILLLLVSINPVEPFTSGHGRNTKKVCPNPFYFIGDQCLYIDHDLRGTWSKMRDLCLLIEGDLVSLSDANLLYDINNYIITNGIDDISYWVGTTDQHKEGDWIWTEDNTTVSLKSPIWGRLNGTQPDGGVDENCGILSSDEFHYLHDVNCDTAVHGLICQANKCPPPFERIGSGCFQIYPEGNYTWEEARTLCSSSHTNTHLAKFDDANLITALREHIDEYNSFWIDGTDAEHEDDWQHSDSSSVKRGTPYWWSTEDGQKQKPVIDTGANCMVIHYASSFHFDDFYCPLSTGAICQYEMM